MLRVEPALKEGFDERLEDYPRGKRIGEHREQLEA
jgi:hypothetical protein